MTNQVRTNSIIKAYGIDGEIHTVKLASARVEYVEDDETAVWYAHPARRAGSKWIIKTNVQIPVCCDDVVEVVRY